MWEIIVGILIVMALFCICVSRFGKCTPKYYETYKPEDDIPC